MVSPPADRAAGTWGVEREAGEKVLLYPVVRKLFASLGISGRVGALRVNGRVLDVGVA